MLPYDRILETAFLFFPLAIPVPTPDSVSAMTSPLLNASGWMPAASGRLNTLPAAAMAEAGRLKRGYDEHAVPEARHSRKDPSIVARIISEPCRVPRADRLRGSDPPAASTEKVRGPRPRTGTRTAGGEGAWKSGLISALWTPGDPAPLAPLAMGITELNRSGLCQTARVATCGGRTSQPNRPGRHGPRA